MALFGGTAPMVIGGFFVSLAALVFHIIGFSTPYWYTFPGGHMGLWQTCGKAPPLGTVCISIPPPGVSLTGEYKAAQALECIALIAYLAAAVFGSLRVFVVKDNGAIYVATALLNFAAGCLGLIGIILYATQELAPGVTLDSDKFHFSFAFCIIAAIGGFCAGVVFILAWRWVHLRQ